MDSFSVVLLTSSNSIICNVPLFIIAISKSENDIVFPCNAIVILAFSLIVIWLSKFDISLFIKIVPVFDSVLEITFTAVSNES